LSSQLTLIASSDDFLLEDSLKRAVAEACASLDDVEPELLADDVTPETVAVEVCSPSLFSPTRVLVLQDVRQWLDAAAPPEAPKVEASGEVEALVAAISEGVPEGVALVMGAWCRSKPKGALVDAVTEAGHCEWIPLPEPPKPWEDVLLSDEQRGVLRQLLKRTAGETRFAPAAERLLMDRLGFAPRLLVAEATKLASAAGEDGEVDEQLVRQLTFPRERSLEVVREAVLRRDARALLDLLAAAAAGIPVCDWQGKRLDSGGLAAVLFGQVFNLLQQLLYLRQVAVAAGLEDEMDPAQTSGRGWYQRRFKPRLAKELAQHLDGASPLSRRGKLPTPWTLGQLFAGAGRYSDDGLLAALAAGGGIEAGLRGQLALENLSAWITSLMGEDSGR
jgi:hypothetical protein